MDTMLRDMHAGSERMAQGFIQASADCETFIYRVKESKRITDHVKQEKDFRIA
jgi:hypothetical protein